MLHFLNNRKDTKDAREKKSLISDTADAFLRSSYAGGLNSKSNIPAMREENKPNLRVSLSEVERDKDYIGPQLQVS